MSYLVGWFGNIENKIYFDFFVLKKYLFRVVSFVVKWIGLFVLDSM